MFSSNQLVCLVLGKCRNTLLWFVNAGSYPVSGLVHVTELSWDPVPFPQDFISQGQEVKVKVIQVDRLVDFAMLTLMT
jgi:ribosomal protein S1